MEHRRPNGNLAQGGFCCTCGASGMSMYGHYFLKPACTPNPTLVRQLNAANPEPGVKPRYVIEANIND